MSFTHSPVKKGAASAISREGRSKQLKGKIQESATFVEDHLNVRDLNEFNYVAEDAIITQLKDRQSAAYAPLKDLLNDISDKLHKGKSLPNPVTTLTDSRHAHSAFHPAKEEIRFFDHHGHSPKRHPVETTIDKPD